MVGMTNVPEVVLAKELGLCYASVGFVVNMAAGMESGPLKLDKIDEIVARKKEKVSRLFMDVFSKPLDQQGCKCSDSIVSL